MHKTYFLREVDVRRMFAGHGSTHLPDGSEDEPHDDEGDVVGRERDDEADRHHRELTPEVHGLPADAVGERREEHGADTHPEREQGLRQLRQVVIAAHQVPLLGR